MKHFGKEKHADTEEELYEDYVQTFFENQQKDYELLLGCKKHSIHLHSQFVKINGKKKT